MSESGSSIFAGHVVHKRLAPKLHGFRYKVFALCLDVDAIDRHGSELRLFSRNRRNLVSFYDADYGAGDGKPVEEAVRSTLTGAGFGRFGARVLLLCYPRILGFVFNPLSVYFCHDAAGTLGCVIYEVTNTFHERMSYVIGVDGGCSDETANVSITSQACAKQMYVSPFTRSAGQYRFHVVPPADRVVVGIALSDASGPVLKTHFCGERSALTDGTLASMLVRHPLMTLKVVGAIHFEALRLWLKGVPLFKHTPAPRKTEIVVCPSPAHRAPSPREARGENRYALT